MTRCIRKNDLRSLAILDLEKGFDQVRNADIDAMRPEELRWLAKWIGTVDTTLERVASVTDIGRVLLRRRNLRPLALGLSTEANEELRRFLEKLPD